MAIVWAEGFDHYGDSPNGGRDQMLAGAWAQFQWGTGNPPIISSDQARTGTYSLRINWNFFANMETYARRVLTASQIVVGCATGLYFNALPSLNKHHGIEFRNNANECIVFLSVESDGAIGVYAGSTRTLLISSDPVITPNSWQHLETKVTIDEIVGSVEVRVNGITVINLTDVNFGAVGSTQIVFGMASGLQNSDSVIYYFDDIVVWNDTGTENVDFIGQCRVETIFPASDTAQADWVPVGAASGYECIDEVPADGDTTYISALDVGDISEFGLETLPPETNAIFGVYVPIKAKLDDVGTGAVTVGLRSGVSLDQDTEIVLTSADTYWGSVFETDPATGLPWTKEGLEAALLNIEKTQ